MIIKQYPQVTCLWCVLNNTICKMAMELKVINKIYGKHKFEYRKWLLIIGQNMLGNFDFPNNSS